MLNGISIYPGLDNTLEENLDLIRKASQFGLKRIFTSLHIPETNRQALKRELMVLLEAARHEKNGNHLRYITGDAGDAGAAGFQTFSLSDVRNRDSSFRLWVWRGGNR